MKGGYTIDETKKIEDVINYSKTLIGVPYRWYRSGEAFTGNDKFYAANDKLITREEIDEKDKCIVCTGLINLMRRFLSLTVPGVDNEVEVRDVDGQTYPGTTGTWFAYLKNKGRLEEIDIYRAYPKGTLLLRNYESTDGDQGHVAVVITEGKKSIIEETIIHSYAEIGYNESSGSQNVGRTGLSNFACSHFFANDSGYYTHVCLPENWLLQN